MTLNISRIEISRCSNFYVLKLSLEIFIFSFFADFADNSRDLREVSRNFREFWRLQLFFLKKHFFWFEIWRFYIKVETPTRNSRPKISRDPNFFSRKISREHLFLTSRESRIPGIEFSSFLRIPDSRDRQVFSLELEQYQFFQIFDHLSHKIFNTVF